MTEWSCGKRASKRAENEEERRTDVDRLSADGRIDYCVSSASGRGSQYRYYSVIGILGYKTTVYGHTEIYGVIRVIVET